MAGVLVECLLFPSTRWRVARRGGRPARRTGVGAGGRTRVPVQVPLPGIFSGRGYRVRTLFGVRHPRCAGTARQRVGNCRVALDSARRPRPGNGVRARDVHALAHDRVAAVAYRVPGRRTVVVVAALARPLRWPVPRQAGHQSVVTRMRKHSRNATVRARRNGTSPSPTVRFPVVSTPAMCRN